MSIVSFKIERQSSERVIAYLQGVTPRLITAIHRALKAWIYAGANLSVTKYFAAGQSVARGAKNTGSLLISRTGTLRRSITASVASGMTPATPSPEATQITAQWVAATPYARIQEYGGYAGRGHRSYIPPRPYLQPALRDMQPALEEAIRGAIDSVLP